MARKSKIKILVDIVERDIDLDRIVREMIEYSYSRGGGALAIFIGYVKGLISGKTVKELEYTTYKPYALKVLKSIAEKNVVEGVHEIRIFHKIGVLKPGEKTLYILVSGTSRGNVFSALENILEEVKHRAPIYKLEKRENGEYWVIGDRRVKRRHESS